MSDGRRVAEELIADCTPKVGVPEDVLDFLRAVLDHNDSLEPRAPGRVSMVRAVDTIRSRFGLQIGKDWVRRVIRVHLNREWTR